MVAYGAAGKGGVAPGHHEDAAKAVRPKRAALQPPRGAGIPDKYPHDQAIVNAAMAREENGIGEGREW